MHEMSLAEGVLQLIEDAAREQNFNRVKTVFLEIGRLSSVEPEAMRFCFDAVTRNSIAAGAALQIIDKMGQGWCMHCAVTVEIQERFGACPTCGSFQVQPTGGMEMRLVELEVD